MKGLMLPRRAVSAAILVMATAITVVVTTCPTTASGQAPQMELPGWTPVFYDDFDRDAPIGSWANDCDSGKVVYQGQQGQQWLSYPRCFSDTFDRRPYRSGPSAAGGRRDAHLQLAHRGRSACGRQPFPNTPQRQSVPALWSVLRTDACRQPQSHGVLRRLVIVATIRTLAGRRRIGLPRRRVGGSCRWLSALRRPRLMRRLQDTLAGHFACAVHRSAHGHHRAVVGRVC